MSDRPSITQVLGRKRRGSFLRVLARTGKVIEAARAVGYTTTTALYAFRAQDEDFAAEWDAAILASADLLEEAAWDRAVVGVEKPILFKGEVVATEIQYSDTLLLAMLASRKKEYQKRTALDANVDVNIKVGIAILPMMAASDADWEKQAGVVQEQQQRLPSFSQPVIDGTYTDVALPDKVKPKAAVEASTGQRELARG